MKKQDSYWKRFVHTGDVTDYLNYTACAKEGCKAAEEKIGGTSMEEIKDSYPEDDSDVMFDEEYEVEDNERDAYREWDGSIG